MNILWQMDPWELSIDVWNTATPNLADKPTLVDGPHKYQSRYDLHTTTQTWQINLLWLMDPQYQSRYDLHTTTQTWQMNLLWLNTMAKV